MKNFDVSSLLSQSFQVSEQQGPEGRLIPRVESRPISVPLPDDVNSAGAWNNIEVKLADVGVGALFWFLSSI
jgi:hypothetical protein